MQIVLIHFKKILINSCYTNTDIRPKPNSVKTTTSCLLCTEKVNKNHNELSNNLLSY